MAVIGLSWLVIGTILVGILPESRYGWERARLIYDDVQIGSKEITHISCDLTSVKNWLSELVHLTCYRICARGLSATIHYHNRSVPAQCVHVTVTHTPGLANKG